MFIRMGAALHTLTNEEVMPWSTILSLLGIGFVSLLPVVYKDKLEKKFK